MPTPFVEDFFERVVNVNWGGAAQFVARDFNGFVVVGSDQNWSAPFDPGGAAGDNNVSSASLQNGMSAAIVNGTPTFVIIIPSQGPNGNYSNKILYSNDGHNWTLAIEFEQENRPYEVIPWLFNQDGTGVVWKPDSLTTPNAGGAFYASFYTGVIQPRVLVNSAGDSVTALDFADGERIYRSIDGTSWKKIIDTVQIHIWKSDQNGFQFGDGLPPGTKSNMPQFCIKPENRGGFPDGLQGYDPVTGIFVKPADLADFVIPYGPRYHGIGPNLPPSEGETNPDFDQNNDPSPTRVPSSAVSVDGDITGSFPTSVSGGPCYAVACNNSKWVATGSGFVDVLSTKDLRKAFVTVASIKSGINIAGCQASTSAGSGAAPQVQSAIQFIRLPRRRPTIPVGNLNKLLLRSS